MHPHLQAGHDALWPRFFDPSTNLIYDVAFTDPSQFPTDEEIRAERPNCAGWMTGMEDCCLTGGFVLDALLLAHRLTGEQAWAQKARCVFAGLASLATKSPTRGFVARGFAPGGREVYPDSSVDQYTSFVYGVWRYARSDLAGEAERRAAARLLEGVAAFVEAHDDRIVRADGAPAIYGDTDAFLPDRACRLLEFYKAAADLSGDEHWQRRYREKAEEKIRLRLVCFDGPDPRPADWNIHDIAQNQLAWRLLYELETDAAIRAACREAMAAQARCVRSRIGRWREHAGEPLVRLVPDRWRYLLPGFLERHAEYDPADAQQVRWFLRYVDEHGSGPAIPAEALRRVEPRYHGLKLRQAAEAVTVVMLSEEPDLKREAADEAWQMLTGFDWAQLGDARIWECLDLGYWWGVAAGVFPGS